MEANVNISLQSEPDLQGPELWRRQCARNLMDCYALGMETLMALPGDKTLESLTRLMVDGMTAVRSAEDEKAFYRLAASSCRECAEVCDAVGWDMARKAGLFRIYASVFSDMGDTREG
jgi:hypothetical protein